MSELHLAKAECRRAVLQARDALSVAQRERDSQRIAQRLLENSAFKSARCVLMTMSMGSEVDTRAIFAAARQQGKRVVLPRVARGVPMLQLKSVDTLGALVPGVMGIMEPRIDAPDVPLAQIDFVLAPGVAFDQSCNRLGYGGGYFDRLLAARSGDTTTEAIVAALAFDCQLVPAVPVTAHDLPVQFLLTPSETIYPRTA